jgi:hypothetical protein
MNSDLGKMNANVERRICLEVLCKYFHFWTKEKNVVGILSRERFMLQ